jgi:two-component system chemotaxis sensor kinase CheA
VELDREMIEMIRDPLTHIIRNAVDHGIEKPAERLKAGKREIAILSVSARQSGNQILIDIHDDGRGIDGKKLVEKAISGGLVSKDDAAQLSPREQLALIFEAGLSTAKEVTAISGRGVGMDVVRSNIQDLGGRISLKSVRGRGMTIQLALPLTLAVMDGMVIKVGQQTYVMPLSAIIECLRPQPSEISNLIGTHGMLQLRGEFVPIVMLGDLLDINSPAGKSTERVVIITDAGEGQRFGLVVDELLGHQQVVIKSIEESYGTVPGIAAATILGNGRVAFILDVEKLSDMAVNSPLGAAITMKAASPALN